MHVFTTCAFICSARTPSVISSSSSDEDASSAKTSSLPTLKLAKELNLSLTTKEILPKAIVDEMYVYGVQHLFYKILYCIIQDHVLYYTRSCIVLYKIMYFTPTPCFVLLYFFLAFCFYVCFFKCKPCITMTQHSPRLPDFHNTVQDNQIFTTQSKTT